MEQTQREVESAREVGSRRQYATFFVAGMCFGVEALKVQEVLFAQDMTQIPLAPEIITGLINLRGQIVTAMDMRRRLNLPMRDAAVRAMNVVIRSEDGAVSLVVDEIGDVIEVSDICYEEPPVNMSAAQKEFVEGIYKLEDSLLLSLNIDKLLRIQTGSGRN